jgi:pimeloyl-ACP methyl ester carboxylesterase
LLDECRVDAWVTVALVERGVRADAVEITLAANVPEPYALRPLDDQVQRGVVMRAVALFERDQLSRLLREEMHLSRLKDTPLATCFDRLERLVARDHPGVSLSGRTRAYVHGERRPRAVVLLHGMSASPAQFERVAADLFDRGHNVVVPRLPRHGHADRLSTALERLRPEDLYRAVDEYVTVARELGERVTVAGFSLGGLLAAWIGQHFEVDRCVPIAPFFGDRADTESFDEHRRRTLAARTESISLVEPDLARPSYRGVRLSALYDSRNRALLSDRTIASRRGADDFSGRAARDDRHQRRGGRREQPRGSPALPAVAAASSR